MAMKCIVSDVPNLLSDRYFGETAGSVVWEGASLDNAVFDDEDIEVDSETGMVEILHQSVLIVPSSDVIGIKEGDSISVSSVPYTVKFWKDDGTGMIEIYMERD